MSLAFTRTQTQNHTTSPMKSFFTSILTLLLRPSNEVHDSLDYSSYDPMAQAEIAMIQDKFTQVSNHLWQSIWAQSFTTTSISLFKVRMGRSDFANQNNTLATSHFQRPMDNGKEAPVGTWWGGSSFWNGSINVPTSFVARDKATCIRRCCRDQNIKLLEDL